MKENINSPGPAKGSFRRKPPMMPGEKAKDFKGTFGKLVKYLSAYKWSVLTVVIFAISSTIFSIIGPKILGKSTTKLFEGVMNMISGSNEGIDFKYISQILIFLLGLYLVSSLFSYIQGYLMTGVSMKMTYNMRKQLAAKIQHLPLNYYDKISKGEVLSHITNDVDVLSHSLNQSITQVITSVTTLLGILIMMFSISVKMTLVALLMIPASLIFIILIVKRSQKHFKAQQEYLGHVNGHIEEMYSSHNVIKAFNKEKDSANQFKEYNDKLYSSAWKSQFFSGMMMPIMNFIGNIGYVVVCILGGRLAVTGLITIGDIQAFIQYVRQFSHPITQVANISNILQQTAAAAERIFNFLDEPEETIEIPKLYVDHGQNTSDEKEYVQIKGQITFDHVKFGYTPDNMVIKDLSVNVKPGQKVAIVGPTGAGKTTIVKLLMRFYDINSGSILIDGHDINNFSREDLRSNFGMVLQDTWLYNASIADNIRYGKLDATDEEVKAAGKAAQVDDFIHKLPDGYDMILNEDSSNISQGQKQLLTIARVILADPKILILDEATSSVDTRTEVLIQKAMDNLMKNRTSFVIAHRLSTIRNADIILVMKDGDIVEQGTHDELIKADGFYANLYNSQFEKSA